MMMIDTDQDPRSNDVVREAPSECKASDGPSIHARRQYAHRYTLVLYSFWVGALKGPIQVRHAVKKASDADSSVFIASFTIG